MSLGVYSQAGYFQKKSTTKSSSKGASNSSSSSNSSSDKTPTVYTDTEVYDYFRVGAEAGVSIPLGRYASYNADNLGYAQAGGNFGLSGVYCLHKNVGIKLSGAYSFNPYNVKKLAQRIGESNTKVDSIGVTASTYDLWSIQAGVEGKINLYRGLSLLPFVQAGLLYISTPRIEQYSLTSIPNKQIITPAYTRGFVYNGGVQFRYLFNCDWALALNVNYLGSQVYFPFSKNNTNYSFTQPVHTLNVGLGVNTSF